MSQSQHPWVCPVSSGHRRPFPLRHAHPKGSKFLIVYFGGGILGNILFVLLAPSFHIAVGASGAIFALGGALSVMRPKLRVFIFPIPVPIPLWVAVIGGFLIISLFPHVAWQAHLGGLVFGLIAGYSLRRGNAISISLTTDTTHTALNILADCTTITTFCQPSCSRLSKPRS